MYCRFDNNLQELITLFDQMFSREIWNNVALCFTRHAQDKVSMRKRAKEHGAVGETPEKKDEWVQKKVGAEFVQYIKNHLGMKFSPLSGFSLSGLTISVSLKLVIS
jgi:hypothetical protein